MALSDLSEWNREQGTVAALPAAQETRALPMEARKNPPLAVLPVVQVTRVLPMEAKKSPPLAALPAAQEIRIKFLFDPRGNCAPLCRHRGASPKDLMIDSNFSVIYTSMNWRYQYAILCFSVAYH